MGRTGSWHDPAVNSLVPAVGVLAADERGCILLRKRRDTGQWAIPTGKREVGETVAQCAVRETLGETGVTTEVTGLPGIYSDPAHVVAYGDGEVRQEYEIILTGRPISGVPAPNVEASDAALFATAELDRLDIHPAQRRQLADWIAGTYPQVD